MDLLIYGVIGDDFWGDGVLAKNVVKELQAFNGDEINVYINSPGGYVHEGNAIAHALERHPATVNIIVDGFALSAASRIMVAGDTVTMYPDSRVMIHDAWNIAAGDAAELRKVADSLDRTSDLVAEAYAKRTGKTRDEMRSLMKAETWFDGREAVAIGFADQVIDSEPQADSSPKNQATMNYHEILNRYRNVPAAFSKPLDKNMPNENETPESVASDQEQPQTEVETPETETVEAPETQTEDTPDTPETPDTGDDSRNQCRLFLNAFGDDGGEYFASGITFEEAQAKHNAKQQARISELETKSASNKSAEPAVVSSVDDNTQNQKRTFADCLKLK